MAPAFITCVFFSCVFLCRWNAVSLENHYPKPSVKLIPESGVRKGGSLTIHCTAEYHNMRFVLYRRGFYNRQEDPPGNEAVFVISEVPKTDEGPYQCRYHTRSKPTLWSEASDDFQIRVLDLRIPSISSVAVQGVKGDYKINCSAPQDMIVKRFFLYKDAVQAPLTDRAPSSGSQRVTFSISGDNARVGTKYRCSYQIRESGEYVESQLSEPIQIMEDDKQKTTVASTPLPIKQETPIIIAIVCAVLLVVILAAALILYIKCKPKKGKGDIQKRNLPLNEEKKAEALEPMYASVTKLNSSNNTVAPEVKKQEEGGDDEGLTYAVINKDALKNKKKNSAPNFQEPETTLYAAVNVH
ncbi:osteoclast-associated immunoglobulin-like receptor isoform X2 [Pleurodeles waltl]|uniref:osteoclast-associated immunoglobulin-like receptor isoform X2 n=1 Tax=Pleurodeles waltl TaxID=8319 RepID=UPI003709B7E0